MNTTQARTVRWHQYDSRLDGPGLGDHWATPLRTYVRCVGGDDCPNTHHMTVTYESDHTA